MKKLFIAITLLMFGNVAIAQQEGESSAESATEVSEKKKKQHDFIFGAETGLNLNSFARAGYSAGFRLGATVEYPFYNFYSLNSGISYSQNGGMAIERTISVSALSPGGVASRDLQNRDVTFHSVQIPLIFSATHPASHGKDIYPEVHIGVVYDAVIRAVETRDEVWTSVVTSPVPIKNLMPRVVNDVTGDYRTHMFSTVVGTNIFFRVSPKLKYYVGFDYKIGAHNVRKIAAPYGEKMRTSQIGMKFGVKF